MNKPLNSTINKIASRPAGVTSLLFVLAISLVLIVMVGGIAALTVREQQQASNTELSNRALQTAEAGVRAAVAKLSSTPTYSKDTCPVDVTDPFGSVSIPDQTITCATVTSLFSTTYEGFLETDRTTQFVYDPVSSLVSGTPYYLKLSWNAPSLGDTAANLADFTASLYPAVEGYSNAAMVEMNIVYWPKTTLAGCTTGATATGTCGFINSTLLFAPGNNNNKIKPYIAVNTACNASGLYKCTTNNATGKSGFSIASATSIPAANVGNYNYAIRITPRYKGTHFAFTAYGTDGSAVAPAQSNKAQIDITAKVGNLYRRVKAEKIILPSAIETIGTSVLYAGRGSNDNASCGITKAAVVDSVTYQIVPGSGSIGPNCD